MKTKRAALKYCTLIGKLFPVRVGVNNLIVLYQCTGIQQVNGWQIVGAGFSLFEWRFTDKQGEGATIAYVKMD